MAKLVVLTQSMAGRSYDLATERTTVGRVEDNAFQIEEPSVSSRHCEILLRGADIVIKDLNSTNGTFINGEKISEGVLKPGQTLRLGNVELKLDTPGAPAASASTPASATSSAPAASAPSSSSSSPPKKEPAKASGGITPEQFEIGGNRSFDTAKDFSRKSKSKNMIIWIAVGVALLIIVVLILVVLSTIKSAPAAGA
ncbi:MAG TPA: FHA domain-containing protein [Verrucomicrobiae bacterium]|jgi:pSer/pThr/pTyr-binding forkhead associated (FHA) protein|nr:FHA domain-containing protein [Verrucomicrobiae bacterium]